MLQVATAAALTLPPAATTAAPSPEVVQIVIDKIAFAPLKRALQVGDVVEFVNNDVVDHTATEKADKGWEVVVRVGRKARVEMKKAGRIDYYCRYHPNMTGTIVVR